MILQLAKEKKVLHKLEEYIIDEAANVLSGLKPLIPQDFKISVNITNESLMYLQTNYFDVVKLDGALTRDILTNERNRDIISSIVYLGKSLHFKIIAEYVETKEQRNKLKELGCDAFQGYLYSKPLEFDELIRWLEQHK